ncbi:MAG: hypothetical protein ACYDGO_08360 [Smithellaceae bacterium]
MKIDMIQGSDSNWSITIDLKCPNTNCYGSLIFDQKRITEDAFLNISSFVIPIACAVCGSPSSISLYFKKDNICPPSFIKRPVEP